MTVPIFYDHLHHDKDGWVGKDRYGRDGNGHGKKTFQKWKNSLFQNLKQESSSGIWLVPKMFQFP